MPIQPTFQPLIFGNYILTSFRVAGLNHVNFLSNSQGLVPFWRYKKTKLFPHLDALQIKRIKWQSWWYCGLPPSQTPSYYSFRPYFCYLHIWYWCMKIYERQCTSHSTLINIKRIINVDKNLSLPFFRLIFFFYNMYHLVKFLISPLPSGSTCLLLLTAGRKSSHKKFNARKNVTYDGGKGKKIDAFQCA